MDAITGFFSSAASTVTEGAKKAAAAVTGEPAAPAAPATGLSPAVSGDSSALTVGARRRKSRSSRRAGKKTARKGGRKHSKKSRVSRGSRKSGGSWKY
jgi:hypothetical protein